MSIGAVVDRYGKRSKRQTYHDISNLGIGVQERLLKHLAVSQYCRSYSHIDTDLEGVERIV
jgi:hypothetical protein